MRFSQLFEIDVALGGGIDSVRNYETKEILRILIQYIGCEVGVRRLSPDSICGSYVYNIINKFIVNGWDTEELDRALTTRQYKFYKWGYKKTYDKLNSTCWKSKIAFELSMLLNTVQLLKKK